MNLFSELRTLERAFKPSVNPVDLTITYINNIVTYVTKYIIV